MVVQVKTRWQIAVTFCVLGGSALLHFGLGRDGLILATLALVPVVVALRMSLSADADGLTVVNLVRRIRIPWAEVSDARLGRVGPATCLGVQRREGRRVNAWVVTAAGAGSSSRARVSEIAGDLRRASAVRNGGPTSFIDGEPVGATADVHVLADRLVRQAARLCDIGHDPA